MKSIELPDELSFNKSLSVDIIDYRSEKNISKQEIILNKNTFSFLVEGKKEVIFDNSSYAITNDSFLLMKSAHCLMTEKLSLENKSYRSVLLFFSNEALYDFIRKYNIVEPDSLEVSSVFSFNYDSFIRRFTMSLLDVIILPKQLMEGLAQVKFEEIMLYLFGIHGASFIYSLINHIDDDSQRFMKTIEGNQLNKLTLKELSFLCNMSISTFKREFEKRYHESPMKWFQDRRLEYAFRLMKEEQKRPSDIYLEVGYESLSSFIQAYKLKYGMTPKRHHKI